MADDWEDWENEELEVKLPVVKAGASVAKPADTAKFAGEDEGEEEEPAWTKHVPQPQQPKESKKKTYEHKDTAQPIDEPLDDPVAEKLRQQRLVEEADLQSARELFGSSATADASLEAAPKTLKESEQYASTLVAKYLVPHARSAHYKSLLKALLKAALAPVSIQEVKDLEACLAGIRSDKLKEDKLLKDARKGAGKKKSLNAGAKGGSAGLDDYKYDEALDDEDDFM